MRLIVNVNVDSRSGAREFLQMMTTNFWGTAGRPLAGGGFSEELPSPEFPWLENGGKGMKPHKPHAQDLCALSVLCG